MKPDYMEAAKQLKADGAAAVFAAVDATQSKNLSTKFEIKGFPAVKFFKNGEFAFDFNERSKEKLIEFMKE